MKKRFSILFVCTGNTCRSPLAEVIAKAELKRAGIGGVNVSSAGTWSVGGGRASENAALAARDMGLSLTAFRSRPLTRMRVMRADLVLTMTRAQKQEVLSRWPDAEDRTFVLPELAGGAGRGIDDPIGGTPETYGETAAELRAEIRRLLPKVRSMTRSRGRQ